MIGFCDCRSYIWSILLDGVIQYGSFLGDSFILLQDNACPHIIRETLKFLEDAGIARMDWPVCSLEYTRTCVGHSGKTSLDSQSSSKFSGLSKKHPAGDMGPCQAHNNSENKSYNFL